MIHATSFLWDFFHPLHADGYQFWSGIAGSFLTSLPGWAVAGLVFFRHHNCKQKRCLRLGHPHPKHGRPVCSKHYHHDVAPPAA